MAAAIDYDIDRINKDKMNFREVEYAGKYRFYFFTFKDELLKSLHIYHISSELEQAVGRSKLISNNNTVHIYASFPVKQGNFIYND